MKIRRLGRLLRVLIILCALAMSMLGMAACKSACAAGSIDFRTDDDISWQDWFKQKDSDKKQAGPKKPNKNEGDGGVNGRGSGSGNAAGCSGTGKTGGKKDPRKGEKDMSLFGANGTQIRNSKPLLLERRIDSTYTYRIDAENPNPGVRAGNIHVQLGGKGSTHYYWRPGGKFYTKEGDPLPKRVQEYIDNDPKSQRAIREGLKTLGEG